MKKYELFKYLTAKSNCTAYDNELIFEKDKQYFIKELDKNLGTIKLMSELGDEETFYLDESHRDYIGDWFWIENEWEKVNEQAVTVFKKTSLINWIIPSGVYICLIYGGIFSNNVVFVAGILGLLVLEVVKWRRRNGGRIFNNGGNF